MNNQLEQDELQEEELEVMDPGQLEGVPKPDPSDNLKEDHPRFKKIYGKMKHLERELKEANERSEAQQKAIESMKEHNKNIASSFDSIKQDAKPVEQPAPPVIETGDLEREIAEAFEEGDYGKAATLQAKLFKTMLGSIKVPTSEDIAKTVKAVSGNTANDMAYYEWRKSNPWYGSNPQAKLYADARGQQLNNEGVLSYEEVLAKVAEETKDLFKITEQSRQMGVPAVEEGTATEGVKSTSKGMKLTAEQKELARMFDISEADMLKQVRYGAQGAK